MRLPRSLVIRAGPSVELIGVNARQDRLCVLGMELRLRKRGHQKVSVQRTWIAAVVCLICLSHLSAAHAQFTDEDEIQVLLKKEACLSGSRPHSLDVACLVGQQARAAAGALEESIRLISDCSEVRTGVFIYVTH